MSSYESALAGVKWENKSFGVTAYFWHSPTNRLIEKPKDRGANWVGYPEYGWLFLWADKKLECDLDSVVGNAAEKGGGFGGAPPKEVRVSGAGIGGATTPGHLPVSATAAPTGAATAIAATVSRGCPPRVPGRSAARLAQAIRTST